MRHEAPEPQAHAAREPRVVVICPTRDRPDMLGRALRSLHMNTRLPDAVIVVDQSRDTERGTPVAALEDARIVHIQSDETGLSRARNRGILAAADLEFEIIGFMDDDCLVAMDWVASALRLLRQRPHWAVLIGEVLETGDASPPAPAPLEEERSQTFRGRRDPWATSPAGGSCFFRRSVFDRVGLFDPLLGQGSAFPGAEDGDMIYRVLKQGLQVGRSSRVRARHHDARTEPEKRANAYRYGLGVGAMTAKHTREGDPFPLPNIFLRIFVARSLGMTYNLLLGRQERSALHRAWLRGMLDGFSGWRRMHLTGAPAAGRKRGPP